MERFDEEREEDGEQLSVGFKFVPTNKQLILDYLQRRRACSPSSSTAADSTTLLREADGLFLDLDIYQYNPWDLPRHRFRYPEKVQREMYFFTPTRGKGRRCDRTAGCGVWHGHGKDNRIEAMDRVTGRPVVIGHTTCFKFEMFADDNAGDHQAKRKRVIKTDWLMHEYRLPSTGSDEKVGLVLCKIYKKKTNSSNLEEEGEEEEEEEMIRSAQQQQQQQQALKRRRIEESVPESLSPAAEESLSLVTHAEEQKEVTFTAEHQRLLRGMLVEHLEPQEQQGSMMTMAEGCEEGRNGVGSTIDPSSYDTTDYLTDGDCGFDLEDILLQDWSFDPSDLLAGLEEHQF